MRRLLAVCSIAALVASATALAQHLVPKRAEELRLSRLLAKRVAKAMRGP